MRILVCGGRNYYNRNRVFEVLDSYAASNKVEAIIHGAASGADRIAGEWAEDRLVKVYAFPAQWEKYGRAAGPIRNQQMLDDGRPTLVIAFPGGRGTANMIKLAEKAGVKVNQIP